MNRIVLTSTAALALALPSAAHAGSPYVGIEGGILFPRSNDVDESVSYSAAQNPATPAAPAPPAASEFDDVYAADYKQGFDLDLVGGYDFGFFRLELELAHKQASLKDVAPDDTTDEFLGALNTTLNRPSASPDPGAPGRPALTIADFNLDGSMRVNSAMLNGLFDLGVVDKIHLYGGGGYGLAQGRALGDKDSAWAWQYIVGARYAINRKVELGVKYRYFNSGALKLQHDPINFAGNPNSVTVNGTDVDQTINARVTPEIEGRFRTRNVLASLIFNL